MRIALTIIVFFLSNIGLAYNVDSALKPSKGIPLCIKSDKFEAFNKKGLYKFIGNVVATKKDLTLKADKMNVYYNIKYKSIDRVVCIGHVVITKNDKIARADKAIYEYSKQKIMLIDNATITSLSNKMSSDVIIYFIKKDYAVSQSTNPKRSVEITIYPNIKKEKK